MLLYYSRTYRFFFRFLSAVLRIPLRIANRIINAGPRAFSNPKKILVQDGYFLGDVLLVSRALCALRAAFPSSEVHLLAQPAGCELLHDSGWIDKCISFTPPWSFPGPFFTSVKAVFSCIRLLRRQRYDCAIDFHGEVRGLAMLFFCNIPCRISFSDIGGAPWCTEAYATPSHAVQQMKRSVYLIRCITGRDYDAGDRPLWPVLTKDSSAQAADSAVKTASIPNILIHPGTANRDKQWPVQRFVELIDMITALHTHEVTIVAGKDDSELTASLVRDIRRPCSLVFPTFSQLELLLKQASVLVCLDSFCQHAASSLGIPVVGVYGPSMPLYSAPLAGPVSIVWNNRIIKPPYREFTKPCPVSVNTAQTVFSAVAEFLTPNSGR